MEDYEAKFCYLYRNTKPGPVDCDFERAINAVSQADANDQATVIAQAQKKPVYVLSVEPKTRKQTYGDAACFRHENGCEITVRQLADSKEAKIILVLRPPHDEPVAIILNDEAKQQLVKWLQINRKEKGGQPIFNRAKSPKQTAGQKARKVQV